MGKIITRIIIIGMVAGGGWYLWTDSNKTEEKDEFVKIEETKNPAKKKEDLTFKIKKSNKNISEKIKENVLKPAPKIIYNKKTVGSVDSKSVIKIVSGDKKTILIKKPHGTNTKNLTVYFYDYGLDISDKKIFAGKITIRAINSGRLSHDLTIKNGDFMLELGRIAPGETKYFNIDLDKGVFSITSQVRIDQEKGLGRSLIVE